MPHLVLPNVFEVYNNFDCTRSLHPGVYASWRRLDSDGVVPNDDTQTEVCELFVVDVH